MTTITLEISDELAARLAPLQDRLPELLSMTVDLFPTETQVSGVTDSETVYPVFREMMDFLISSPTPEKIIAFKISSSAQERLEDLLDKNREDGLTNDEVAELDIYERVNQLLILLKAHARLALSSPN